MLPVRRGVLVRRGAGERPLEGDLRRVEERRHEDDRRAALRREDLGGRVAALRLTDVLLHEVVDRLDLRGVAVEALRELVRLRLNGGSDVGAAEHLVAVTPRELLERAMLVESDPREELLLRRHHGLGLDPGLLGRLPDPNDLVAPLVDRLLAVGVLEVLLDRLERHVLGGDDDPARVDEGLRELGVLEVPGPVRVLELGSAVLDLELVLDHGVRSETRHLEVAPGADRLEDLARGREDADLHELARHRTLAHALDPVLVEDLPRLVDDLCRRAVLPDPGHGLVPEAGRRRVPVLLGGR